jgi:hypothetical protein
MELEEDCGGVILEVESPCEVLTEDNGNAIVGDYFLKTNYTEEDDAWEEETEEVWVGREYSDEDDD